MTASILIKGQLWSAAERRASRAGKPYVRATLLDDDDGFWSVVAFTSDTMDELCRLDEGDVLAAQGALHVELFERDGATRVCRKIIADRILALRPAGALKGAPRRSATTMKRKTIDRYDADAFDGVSI